MCAASIHIKSVPCAMNSDNCDVRAEKLAKTEWIGARYGYVVATSSTCHVMSMDGRFIDFTYCFAYNLYAFCA